MRIAIALCFSAVLCTVYAIPTDNLEGAKLQVQNAISTVERAMQNIERVHADTKEDTILTVTDRMWEQMDNFRDYVELLLQSMRREVDNAKLFRGTDAQKCYDTNSKAINIHSNVAYKASTKCQESAETSIESSLKFLDSFMSLGADLLQQLDDIFVNCHDKDNLKMQSCVLSEFGKIKNSVNEFEEDIKYIEYNALPTSNYVVLQATQCITNAYLLARFESQSAMMSNSRCVRKAVEKNKPSFIA